MFLYSYLVGKNIILICFLNIRINISKIFLLFVYLLNSIKIYIDLNFMNKNYLTYIITFNIRLCSVNYPIILKYFDI